MPAIKQIMNRRGFNKCESGENKVKVKLATVVKGDPKASFSVATTSKYKGGRYYFALDTYLIMLSVKQGRIK